MGLELNQTERNGEWTLSVKGEVDLYTSPELRTAIMKLLAKAKHGLGVDLSQVPYMDSSGVATLVEGLKSARSTQKKFVLVSPSESVMKVLQLARLDAVFEVCDLL